MTVRIDNSPAVCSPPANIVADLGIADLAAKVSGEEPAFVIRYAPPGAKGDADLVILEGVGAKRAIDLKAQAEMLAMAKKGYTYKVTRADSTRGVHTFKFSAASK